MALRGLRNALASKTLAVKDETFATVVLLCLFEDITGERNSLTSSHTQGFGLLMKLRGEGQLDSAQGRDLFNFAYAHTLIEILALRERPRYETDWIVHHLDGSDPVFGLLVFASKLSRLFLETASYQELPDVDKIVSWIETAKIMDLELAGWAQHLPDSWLPLVVQSTTGMSLLTYQRIAFATIWKYYRAVRIIVQRLTLELNRKLASVAGDSGLDDEIFQRNAEAMDVIENMITDTCRSIPYAFGDIDMLGSPPPSSEPRMRAIYGYTMLWPLWYIYSCGLATPAQTEQMRSALARVGSALGIKLGLVLAGDGEYQNIVPGHPGFMNTDGRFSN
ncbi:hypothetical protein EYZ11_005040 [Aspergillus tanneri]|nr:hypothetical protein EYZ11_005040 [Aspergillus tanneri]